MFMVDNELQLKNEESPIKQLVRKYDLTESEHLVLVLSVAPFYFGSPLALLRSGQEVDIERYAKEIVAQRSGAPN